MALFCNPEKQQKLEDAVRNGLIIRSVDTDGIMRYRLTQEGVTQWMRERALKTGWVF